MSAAVEESPTIQDQDEQRRSCESGVVQVLFGVQINQTVCGAPATYQSLNTCCGHVRYICAEHAGPAAPHLLGELCVTCAHKCFRGVCYHRVVMPL